MRNRFWTTAFALGAACFALAQPAFSWDKMGHMIIAQIAYDRLTPTARRQVNALITQFNSDPLVTELAVQYKPYNAVTAGAWMDDLKPVTKEFNTWHYINLNDNVQTAQDVRQYSQTDRVPDVYKGITQHCLPTLEDAHAAPADKARMLAFLIHLVGDIHQPLHTVGRERGGNDHFISPLPSDDLNMPVRNLHAFWDGAYRYDSVQGVTTLIVMQSDLPRPFAPDQGNVKTMADDIEKHYLTHDRAQLQETDPAVWALESARIANTFAFTPPPSSALPPDYVHKAHDTACSRLALAGYRLGNLLNKIFK